MYFHICLFSFLFFVLVLITLNILLFSKCIYIIGSLNALAPKKSTYCTPVIPSSRRGGCPDLDLNISFNISDEETEMDPHYYHRIPQSSLQKTRHSQARQRKAFNMLKPTPPTGPKPPCPELGIYGTGNMRRRRYGVATSATSANMVKGHKYLRF